MCYEFEWEYRERKAAQEARKALEQAEKERRAKAQQPKKPAPDRSRDAEPVPV